ncbi:MAG: minC [Ramlibacter sp.]|jgi:septum site-determining protein MinC|nr:minC [Ramlibacter sp.]
MTVAITGRTPATFEIKSANLPLLALLLKSADLGELGRELAVRFGDIPDFFDNDPLVIDLAPLQAQGEAPVDFEALVQLLRPYRVLPVAVKGGSQAQMQAALEAGLAAAPEAGLRPGQPEREEQPASAPALPREEREQAGALVVDKPLRSGQQVYARGRDLVVMAMVNPGAEVIADGNIHVYAPLRGKAIAGARGNTEARIFSLCLEPELISIAGVYRTSEVPLPADVLSRPTQVRLVGGSEGKLVMDPIKT